MTLRKSPHAIKRDARYYGTRYAALRGLWTVFRNNKRDAKTLGEFMTCAVDHIRTGGNVAYCTTTLADGTPVKLSIERVTPAGKSL